MRFVRSDDELAWVLAHEIAHDVLNHSQNARLRAMLSAFLGATVGDSRMAAASPPQSSLEAQADYVGSYIMARAGYDLEGMEQEWRRREGLQAGQGGPDQVRFVPFWSDVPTLVAQIAKRGDLVLTVGAGDVTMIGPEVLRRLVRRLDATKGAHGQL